MAIFTSPVQKMVTVDSVYLIFLRSISTLEHELLWDSQHVFTLSTIPRASDTTLWSREIIDTRAPLAAKKNRSSLPRGASSPSSGTEKHRFSAEDAKTKCLCRPCSHGSGGNDHRHFTCAFKMNPTVGVDNSAVTSRYRFLDSASVSARRQLRC